MFNYGISLEEKSGGYGKKYYGKYRARVTNIDDPQKMGRIKAICPKVLGPSEETAWALPNLPPGYFRLPKIGDLVWLEFEDGDPNYPIWTGMFFTNNSFPFAGKTDTLIDTNETILIRSSKETTIIASRLNLNP